MAHLLAVLCSLVSCGASDVEDLGVTVILKLHTTIQGCKLQEIDACGGWQQCIVTRRLLARPPLRIEIGDYGDPVDDPPDRLSSGKPLFVCVVIAFLVGRNLIVMGIGDT